MNLPSRISSEASSHLELELADLRIEPSGDRRGRGDHELVTLPEQDDQRSGLDQRPAALDDRFEHALEVGLATDGDRNLGRGLQPLAPLGACRRDRDGGR